MKNALLYMEQEFVVQLSVGLTGHSWYWGSSYPGGQSAPPKFGGAQGLSPNGNT